MPQTHIWHCSKASNFKTIHGWRGVKWCSFDTTILNFSPVERYVCLWNVVNVVECCYECLNFSHKITKSCHTIHLSDVTICIVNLMQCDESLGSFEESKSIVFFSSSSWWHLWHRLPSDILPVRGTRSGFSIERQAICLECHRLYETFSTIRNKVNVRPFACLI